MLYKRRGSVFYWLRFSHGGQRLHFSTGRSDFASATAEARRIRYEYEKKNGAGGRAVGVPLLVLRQLDVERSAAEGHGPRQEKTIDNHWRHLGNILGPRRDVSALLLVDIDAYEGARRRQSAVGQTIRREVQALVRGMRLAKRAGLLPALPFDPEDLKTIRSDPKNERTSGKSWSLSEINAVLDKLSDKAKKARYPDILRLAMGTGVRLEELRRIDPSWLRPWQGTAKAILSMPATATKGRKPRDVPLTEEMAATVRELFPLSPNWKPNHALELACERLKLSRVLTPRDLRKWYLNQVATTDVLAAQRLAGHSSVKTTGIYVESDSKRAMAAGAKVLRLVTSTGDSKVGVS